MTRVPSTQHPLVAREGRWLLLCAAVATFYLLVAGGWQSAFWGAAALAALAFYFRDPHRDSPSLPLAVVAPVDGRVVRAGPASDPWLTRDAVAVTLRMRLTDVHTLFSPIEGKIIEQWSTAKRDGLASAFGRGSAYQIQTDEGDDVVMHIATPGMPASAQIYYQPGERVGHGRRMGYAPLGCEVTIYAAASARLDSAAAARTTAAASVLLTLVHEEPVSAIRDADTPGDDVASELLP